MRRGERDFQRDGRGFVRRYRDLWLACPEAPPELGEVYGRARQRENERESDRLTDELESRLTALAEGRAECGAWRDELKGTLRQASRRGLGLPSGCLESLLSDDYFEMTRGFVRSAYEFDPALEPEALLQALRNVWVAGSIQLLRGERTVLTPAIFAYSMLYPCTDNFLDDPGVPAASKRAFGRRLGRRLAGERPAAEDERERAVFALLDRIEEQHPRRRWPDVHRSLLAIHRAQLRSLGQQGARVGGAVELLEIGLAKGGSSVLADGYVVAGELGRAEARFLFGYGALLQFLDDLQDARRDRRAGHATLFSAALAAGRLDRATGRLLHFLRRVLDSGAGLGLPGYATVRELIARNCEWLVLQAVAEHPGGFSAAFRERLEPYAPVRFGYARRHAREVARRLSRGRDLLDGGPGLRSVLDALS